MRIFIIVFFLFISGCTHIVINENYSVLDSNQKWKTEYIAGKRYGSKTMPSLDKVKNTFENDSVKINVIAGYQKIKFIGPLLLPVIPLGDFGVDGQLEIKLEIDCAVCDYELNKLKLIANNETFYPIIKEIDSKAYKSYLLGYSIEYVDLDSFQLHFTDVIDFIPQLTAFKKSGEWFMVNASL